MKSLFILAGVVLLSPLLFAQQADSLKNQKEKVSYSIGLDFGRNMKRQSIDIDVELVARGIRDGLTGVKPALTDSEKQVCMTAFQQEVMAKRAEIAKKQAEENKKEGEAFLAENKKKPGVITLPSGLQYKILKQGSGRSPKVTDSVTTHYRGTLINGKEFQSSYKLGQPATFIVGGVIPGWVEALQKMKVGSKWQLFIPAELAYGGNGAGDEIGPNSTLIFEVELLAIK